jgi:predicted Rossmann-fold nucleotide-binding protein
MLAANEGAAAGSKGAENASVGIRVDLPFEQEVNAFVQQAYEHETFFTRLHHFVLASDAFVVTPGGIGTLLEAAMIWQLLQVRHIQDTPLIFIGKMWSELVDWARTNMISGSTPLANAEDISIAVCLNTADEAITLLQEHHNKWLTRT